MSYHQFPNIGEILRGDIVDKIRKGIGTNEFQNRECYFNSTTKVKGTCEYRGEYFTFFLFDRLPCIHNVIIIGWWYYKYRTEATGALYYVPI